MCNNFDLALLLSLDNMRGITPDINPTYGFIEFDYSLSVGGNLKLVTSVE